MPDSAVAQLDPTIIAKYFPGQTTTAKSGKKAAPTH
jgi:hypothetical protein